MNQNQKITEHWLAKFGETGARITAPRAAVVEVMAESERILSATEIYDLARLRCPSMGLVTVYRTLESLEDLGLVQRVHLPQGCQSFMARQPGHFHLLICTQCGRAEHFGGDDLGALFQRVAAESGYLVKEHWLQLFGLCADCQLAAA